MERVADVLICLSVIAVILSALGAFVVDVWLASTQWLTVATILAIWGTYAHLRLRSS